MKHFQDNEKAEFDYDWLIRQKYEFKLLALLAVLADNNLAYRGTLSDMCAFFGVASGNSRTDRKIKDAIIQLETDGLLKKITDGRTYTLTLSKKAEKHRRVIRIQKEWVMIAKGYSTFESRSVSIDWVPLLKVWLYLINGFEEKRTLTTSSEIAIALNLSISTVKAARAALEKDIEAILVEKKYKFFPEEEEFSCLGSEITPTAWVSDKRSQS